MADGVAFMWRYISMEIDLDIEEFKRKLESLQNLDVRPAISNSLTEMYNRAADDNPKEGGTPFDDGELQRSRIAIRATRTEGEFGYTKEYSPHVEYGHRTRNGGYVEGQRFLQNNVEIQRPIFYRELSEFVLGRLNK